MKRIGVVGLIVIAGCQASRGTVNRVQPDYIDKRDLIPNQYGLLTANAAQGPTSLSAAVLAKEPVFYTQTTLISKPTTTGFTGLTSYSESDKIRWEVTENQLNARQAYEFIDSAPTSDTGIGQNPQTGDVVAAFKISKHFDIRRDYNTTTGEELNVVVENDTDRPWYQRQFMHVDWSQNLVTGYNSVLLEAEFNNKVTSEPVPVFVNTPDDPNAPVFVYQGKDDTRKLNYFDVVNKAVLHPETTKLSYSEHPGSTTSYSSLPVCFLNATESATDCAPSEVTFRVSFKRVDPSRDYEPASLTLPLPDTTGSAPTNANNNYLDMERFGFFDVMRVGYDPTYHTTLDTRRIHFAARHNLWVYHHAPVYGDTTGTACNSDDDCASDASHPTCMITPAGFNSHRGQCAALAVNHITNELACASDDDCRQVGTSGGVSRTAVCDSGACAEHFYRCSSDSDCGKIDPLSTCDRAIAYTRADNLGLCLLPFSERQVRPVVYHESTNYPDYMQPVTEQIVTEWNDAFVTAVTSARRHECELRNNIDPSATDPASNMCAQAKGKLGLDSSLGADAQFVFVGCHSPVWGSADGPGNHSQADVDAAHAKGWDLSACGPQGTLARLGDLRYSMIGAITDHDAQGYWGLANIAADRETGEMVAGRGAVWQTITDFYSTYLVQLIQVLNGDLDANNVADGSSLIAGMKQLGLGVAGSAASGHLAISEQVLDAPFKQPNALTKIANEKMGISRLMLPDAGWFKPGMGIDLLSHSVNVQGALDIAQQRLMGAGFIGDGTDRGSSRLLSLSGTDVEARMMNTDQARLAPTSAPDDAAILPETLEQASPLRGQSRAIQHVIQRVKSNLSAYQCGMEAGFSDDMLLGLAQRLANGAPIDPANPDDKNVSFGRVWNFRPDGRHIDYTVMQQYAAQFIHHGVLAHELGHSIGQRHNFTASADAVNYHDNYWKLRTQGHNLGLAPRYEYLADPKDGKYYSQQELDGRVDEWAYSSVMDYKGLNEDAHGIGRYDYAFVKNGYVGMVEAFKNVKDLNGAVVYFQNTAGNGFSTPLDLRAGIKGMHYTQLPQIFGTQSDGVTPNVGSDNRYDVFLRETGTQAAAGLCEASGAFKCAFTNTTADGAHVLVPYRFDSDERAGLVWQDQRYDAGGDAFESLHYVAAHLLDYYFVNSYARLRSGFSTGKYVDRMWSRSVEQLRQTTQLLAFDLINFGDFFGGQAAWNSFLTDPKVHGGFTNHVAMNLGADAFVALVTMPEMGVHASTAKFDGTLLLSPPAGGSGTAQIDINDGRAFESNWRNDVGFFWYDMLNRAGAYYDKVMALQALTDPELLLLQRDTPTDIRLFQLSFYTMYPEQMIRMFGGLLSEDEQDYSPIYSTSQQAIQRTHVATLADPAATRGRTLDNSHLPLDPQDHFTVQLWSAVQTMSQFPATYDQRYMEYARLWVDGSIEAINPGTSPTVSFIDPFSGQTYRALSFDGTKDGVGTSDYVHPCTGTTVTESGIGAKMIYHLRDIETLRQKAITASDTTTAQALEQQLKKYLDAASVVRHMTKFFGQGNSALP